MSSKTEFHNFHIRIGSIPGMSEIAGFEGEIQVESFAWGMSKNAHFGCDEAGRAPRVQVQDLTFTHDVDKSSPMLMIACCTPELFSEAVLTCCRSGTGLQTPYFTITLRDVTVSRVESTGTKLDAIPTERVTLAFREYEVAYQEQGDDGNCKGGPVITGFDVQRNCRTR